MNKKKKAEISELLDNIYSGVVLSLDPTDGANRGLFNTLQLDMLKLRIALELD